MSHPSSTNGYDGTGDGHNAFANDHNSPLAQPSTDPNLWPTDRSQYSQVHSHNDVIGGASGITTSPNLAVEAARYDPFKGSELGDQASRARAPSTRGGFGYRSGPSFNAPKGLSASFGQPGSPREISQPVSAMRTQDATDASVPEDNQTQDDGTANDGSDASAIRVANLAFEREGGVADANGGHPTADGKLAEDSFNSTYGLPNHRTAGSRAPGAADASRSGLEHDLSLGGMEDEPSSSSISQQDNGTKGVTAKRKKNFKYLQDEGNPAGPSTSRGPLEKRKKVQKACRPCKRSHMPCQEQRPCPRCVKRGIPDLCIDAEPIARRPRKDSDRQHEQEPSQVQAQGQSQHLPHLPHGQGNVQQNDQFQLAYHEEIADIRQLAKAAHAASSSLGAFTTPPSYDPALDAAVAQEPQPPPRASDYLTQEGEIEALRSALLPESADPLDKYGYLPLRILADEELIPSAADLEKLRTSKKGDFSLTRSYADLARWAVSGLHQATAARLDDIITSQRRELLREGAELSKHLAEMESASLHLMEKLQRDVLPNVPVPMLLLRRSGQIYCGNTAAKNSFPVLELSDNHNIIKWGQDGQAVKLAELLGRATTTDLDGPVSKLVSLTMGANNGDLSSLPGQRRYVVTLEAKSWTRSDGVQGSEAVMTRLPLYVTCLLTPLDEHPDEGPTGS